jgi:hypothetical protein
VSNQYPQCDVHDELMADFESHKSDKDAKTTQNVINESNWGFSKNK